MECDLRVDTLRGRLGENLLIDDKLIIVRARQGKTCQAHAAFDVGDWSVTIPLPFICYARASQASLNIRHYAPALCTETALALENDEKIEHVHALLVRLWTDSWDTDGGRISSKAQRPVKLNLAICDQTADPCSAVILTNDISVASEQSPG